MFVLHLLTSSVVCIPHFYQFGCSQIITESCSTLQLHRWRLRCFADFFWLCLTVGHFEKLCLVFFLFPTGSFSDIKTPPPPTNLGNFVHVLENSVHKLQMPILHKAFPPAPLFYEVMQMIFCELREVYPLNCFLHHHYMLGVTIWASWWLVLALHWQSGTRRGRGASASLIYDWSLDAFVYACSCVLVCMCNLPNVMGNIYQYLSLITSKPSM